MRRRFGLVLCGLFLAGCGSTVADNPPRPPFPNSVSTLASRSIGAGATAATGSEPVTTPTTVDLAALAGQFGCDGYTVQPVAPLTTAYATCTLAGSEVQLYAFASPDMAAAFIESLQGLGVTADQLVAGDGYLIAPNDVSQLPAIQAAV
jgi:hypothetical protein